MVSINIFVIKWINMRVEATRGKTIWGAYHRKKSVIYLQNLCVQSVCNLPVKFLYPKCVTLGWWALILNSCKTNGLRISSSKSLVAFYKTNAWTIVNLNVVVVNSLVRELSKTLVRHINCNRLGIHSNIPIRQLFDCTLFKR